MLPPTKPRVPIENYLLNLRDDIKIIGIHLLLKKWHNKFFESYREASRKIGISDTFYGNIINGKLPVPIWLLKLFVKVDPTLAYRIYKENYFFTARVEINSLPKFIDPHLAYYIGYLHGDGHVDSNRKRVSFFDKYASQIEVINKLTKILFGISGKVYRKEPPTLDVGSVTINSFLSDVIHIKRGKRGHNEILPQIRDNPLLLKWYLCGLFDAEGAMPLNPKRKKDLYIDIAMTDIELISTVKELLETFDIFSYGPYKRTSRNKHTENLTIESELRIRKLSEIEKFLKIIDTLHPDKIRRKKIMLSLLKKKMPG